jgi:hypothetical protein
MFFCRADHLSRIAIRCCDGSIPLRVMTVACSWRRCRPRRHRGGALNSYLKRLMSARSAK